MKLALGNYDILFDLPLSEIYLHQKRLFHFNNYFLTAATVSFTYIWQFWCCRYSTAGGRDNNKLP